jgi:AraC-like DNA-binding protein
MDRKSGHGSMRVGTGSPLSHFELEDKCLIEGCERRIGWSSGCMTKCEYGHDLTKTSRAVPASELSAEAYIAGRLGLPGYDPVRFFDGAYLDEAIELMDKIGRAAIDGNHMKMPTPLSLGVSRRATILKGFEILRRGEIGFEDFLDSVAQNNIDYRISRSLTIRYGWFFTWLSHRPRSQIHDRLLALMVHHAKGHVPTEAYDDPFLTLSLAAKQLNISPWRLRRLLTAFGLARPHHRRGVLLGVQRVHVEQIRSILRSHSTLADAARRIGERQEILIRLVKCGILATPFRAATGEHATHLLKKADVDELIDRLTDGVPQLAVVPGNLMPLGRIVSRASMPQTEIIRLILAGKLKPAARLAGAPPISGLYFLCNDAYAAYLSETRTALTSEAAASEIGIHHGGFRALVQGNYIKRESRVASKCRVVAISRVELDRFKAKYAAGTEFAQILGTSASGASARLIQLGLQPAISRDKCRKLFFYREDIETLLSRLRSPRKSSRNNSNLRRQGGSRFHRETVAKIILKRG